MMEKYRGENIRDVLLRIENCDQEIRTQDVQHMVIEHEEGPTNLESIEEIMDDTITVSEEESREDLYVPVHVHVYRCELSCNLAANSTESVSPQCHNAIDDDGDTENFHEAFFIDEVHIQWIMYHDLLPVEMTCTENLNKAETRNHRKSLEDLFHHLMGILKVLINIMKSLNPCKRWKRREDTCCHNNCIHKNNRAHFCQCRQCHNTAFIALIVCFVLGHSKNQEENFAEKDKDADEYYDISSNVHSEDSVGDVPRSATVGLRSKGAWLLLANSRQTKTVTEQCHRRMHSVLEIFYIMFIYGYCVSFALYFFNVLPYLILLRQLSNAKNVSENERRLQYEKVEEEDGEHGQESKANNLILLTLFCFLLHNIQLLQSYVEDKLCSKKEEEVSELCELLKIPLKQNVKPDETRLVLKQLLHSKPHYEANYSRDILVYPAYRNAQTNTINSILERFSTPSPPNRRETMSFELLRLCTLHDFPCRNSPSLVRLTQAGFYYEGNDDEVICFACHIRRRNWQATDDPMVIHRQMSPDCPFLRNEAGNIPVSYAADSVDGSQTASTISHGRDLQTDNASVLVSSQGSVPKDSATGSVVRDCGTLQGSVAADCGTIQSHVVRESGNVPGSVISQSQTVQGGNMATSQNTQPRYTMDAASAAVPAAIATPHSRNRTAGSYQAPRTVRKPKYPEYANRPTRLESYRNWPPEMTQNPLDMTEAGFFFTGNGDCARCFHCGIGLKNWDPLDNPWVEHARWSQSCPYLLEIKGQDFIDLVMDAAERAEQDDESPAAPSNSQPLDPDNAPRSTTDSGRTDSSSVTTASARDNTQMPKFPLQAPAPQSVISQGYSPKIVKQAMDKIIERTGWVSVTTDAILKEITDSGYATASTASAGASASSGDGNVNQEYKVPKDKTVLRKENKELKELTTCKICLDAEVTIVFLPCGHLVSCAQCSPAMRKCPICRTLVKGTVKTNLMEG